MRLILLPGMDGTGKLFEPFAAALEDETDVSIISLPSGEEQDYDFLTQYVRDRLPQDDKFILLAESFSGPVAYRLLQDNRDNIVSAIFVATFLKRPTILVYWMSYLVANFMLKKSIISNIAVRMFLTGFRTGREFLRRFWQVTSEAGIGTIKRRLKAVALLAIPEQEISIPCFYLQAQNDRMVPGRNVAEFEKLFEELTVYRIDGPHLILQTRAKECAAVVSSIVAQFRD